MLVNFNKCYGIVIAFADDIAIVCEKGKAEETLIRIKNDFAEQYNMELNMGKC